MKTYPNKKCIVKQFKAVQICILLLFILKNKNYIETMFNLIIN